MVSIRFAATLLCLMLFNSRIYAQTLPFQNLDQSSMEKVVGDMSANFLHTSVMGANTLGSIFGFEVGVVGGQTSSPHLNEVVNSQPGVSGNASKLMNAEALGMVSVPLGFTVEAGLLPKVGGKDFKIHSFSLAVKWTATEVLLSDLPLSLAIKGEMTKAGAEFSQTISGTPTDFTYDNTETAFMLLASKNLAIVEPYVGVGLVSAKGTLTASGSGSVFSPSFSTSSSGSATKSGSMYMVGAEVKLLVLKLGAEYSNVLGANRFMGKLSFYF